VNSAIAMGIRVLLRGICIGPVLGTALAAAQGTGPLQVFIMAGQSNMEGHGYAEPVDWLPAFVRPQASLSNLVKNPTLGKYFQKFVDANGKYVTRKDVWVHYRRDGSTVDATGDLRVGFGAHDTSRAWTIGPELGFGWVMGDSLPSQVLLIKTCWGGKSLIKDFRPPSSGGTTGEFYTKMITQSKEVMANIKKYFPAYGGSYKLAGFAWHQGWNDYVNDTAVDEYEKNLANLIRDVRKDLGAPGLPFVVGESGMACFDPKDAKAQKLCAAQAAPASYPEFKGTVAYVRTRDFYDLSLSPWDDYGYHWHGSFYSYSHVGESMGEAMVKLLPAGSTGTRPIQRVSAAASVPETGMTGGLFWKKETPWKPGARKGSALEPARVRGTHPGRKIRSGS
jgi:hypothetical protein